MDAAMASRALRGSASRAKQMIARQDTQKKCNVARHDSARRLRDRPCARRSATKRSAAVVILSPSFHIPKGLTSTTRIDGTAAFFIAHLVSSIIYHADGNKEKCDLRRKATGIN